VVVVVVVVAEVVVEVVVPTKYKMISLQQGDIIKYLVLYHDNSIL
jgi:hypothetical protein